MKTQCITVNDIKLIVPENLDVTIIHARVMHSDNRLVIGYTDSDGGKWGTEDAEFVLAWFYPKFCDIVEIANQIVVSLATHTEYLKRY
jgi:hypothetical protein